MAPSATTPDSPPPPVPGTAENHLQPFFVLHKASARRYEKKSGKGGNRTRRQIHLSSPLPKTGENPKSEKPKEERGDGDDGRHYANLRMEAFEAVWAKIDSTIKDVLRSMNTNVFKEIHQWVLESFNTITSSGSPGFREATLAFPIVTDALAKRIFTGVVLTKNMEFVDDLLTFGELGLHLKSQGCHVANLSSADFSVKHGIGGCLRSLLRQFSMITVDAADISVLAAWYREQQNCNNPVVIIIEDMERCSGSVLSAFIRVLSEWVLKLPVILVMGVATTSDALKNVLPSDALHHLCPHQFILGTPSERMDAVVEAVLVKQCSVFSISHKVAVFMRNYFVSQDGTLTSFIRALKIACAQHFSTQPLSFILPRFILEEDNQMLQAENFGLAPERMLKHAFELPSFGSNKTAEQTGETLVHGLSVLKISQNHWGAIVLCLYEAGKYEKMRMLDLFCEALDPEAYNPRSSDIHCNLERDSGVSSNDSCMHEHYSRLQKGSYVHQAICKVRYLSALELHDLLKRWKKHTLDIPQLHDKVKELLSLLKCEDGKRLKQDLMDISKRLASRSRLSFEKDSVGANEKVAKFLEFMIRSYMKPLESVAFHEIFCFKNVDELQLALIGDPRKRIQADLLEFYTILRCSCCCRTASPSMHDSSIMYNLAQEHGDLINLHDWYQSFKLILCSSNKKKQRAKYSPSPKKRKAATEPTKPSEASMQEHAFAEQLSSSRLREFFECLARDVQILCRELPFVCRVLKPLK